MESLLRRQDLNDYDKWAAYSQLLQRYLHKTQEEREPVSLRITEAQQQQGGPAVGARDTVPVVTTPAVGDLAQRGALSWNRLSKRYPSLTTAGRDSYTVY